MLGLGKRTGGNGHFLSSDLQSRETEEKKAEVKLASCIRIYLSHITSIAHT